MTTTSFSMMRMKQSRSRKSPRRHARHRPVRRRRVRLRPAARRPHRKVVVAAPKQFEAASEIAEHLRDRRAVLLNLEKTDPAVARRLIDFLSGVAYAQDGKIRRVASATYIITPFNVDLMGDQLDDMESGEFHL